MHTYINTHMHTYKIDTHTHTYMHTHIHTHTHTLIWISDYWIFTIYEWVFPAQSYFPSWQYKTHWLSEYIFECVFGYCNIKLSLSDVQSMFFFKRKTFMYLAHLLDVRPCYLCLCSLIIMVFYLVLGFSSCSHRYTRFAWNLPLWRMCLATGSASCSWQLTTHRSCKF